MNTKPVPVKPKRLVAIIKGVDLRPNMLVTRDRLFVDAETIGSYSGSCNHGHHFGAGCYDKISSWYLWR